ncbi:MULTISPECIES: hypothetical protein [Streptomyces]|uniref:Uncharacterized protein n=1 Tax=Streptomyces doudnae TaxID=3075536 RepID=A0ABD5EIG6_9ACTN|nr:MULTISPECIES: hypothetical protein [unclassified Streptomyces]MDT0434461.1 hypothetical protein [Streptomyces sp. DSM 41981]MYQ69021.1 hypothetical protein [Streptomyces sp. SID4950]SCE50771.1 hypothetical protein GA0115242_143226 [Streptomyces sp. SolWspMP-5a-2]
MLDSTQPEPAQNASDIASDANENPISEIMNDDKVQTALELKAMHTAFEVLEPLKTEAQGRAVRWLLDALGMSNRQLRPEADRETSTEPSPSASAAETHTQGDTPTPRSFMTQKKPNSLVERIACLSYYLSYYRDTPHFKTSDLVLLNTEAAAPKFGNASRDVDNADRQSGYLVTAGKRLKQITPRGEAMVQSLPDREAVAAALREHPYKARKPRDTTPKRVSEQNKDDQ